MEDVDSQVERRRSLWLVVGDGGGGGFTLRGHAEATPGGQV